MITQGKLHTEKDTFGNAKGIGIFSNSDDEGTPLIIAFCWTEANEETQTDNAKELVKRWNCHTDLLDVCKGLMEVCDDGSARFDDPEPDSIFVKAAEAIAKAEE